MRPHSVSSPPLRRLALVIGALVVAALSCGREPTAPGNGGAVRYGRVVLQPVFAHAAVFQAGTASSVVPFERVRIVLRRADSTIALDTTVVFPPGTDSLTLTLSVALSAGAPASGEPLTASLGYLNAAGAVVFSGSAMVTAVPPGAGAPAAPVTVNVGYVGPGASATRVVISPRTLTVTAGATFDFTAQALDAAGAVIAGTPVVFTSLNPALAILNSPASGSGSAGTARGTARIVAALLTGPADTATLTVQPVASAIVMISGNGQSATVGQQLAQPVVVQVTASDGEGFAGRTVAFAAQNGGSVGSASVVTDGGGFAQTTWRLGPAAGPQTLTATASGLSGSPVTFGATAVPIVATRLVVTTQPVSGTAGVPLEAVSFTAQDAAGNVATTFTGVVTVALGASPTVGALLTGTTSVDAVAGVATFTNLRIDQAGTGYTLVGSASGLTSATTNAFNVAVGATSRLVFTVQPSNASAGAAISPAIVVQARDAVGNPTPTFTGTVTLTLGANPGAAILGGTLSAAAVNGEATFSNVTVNRPASGYTVIASATGLASATSAPFDVALGPAARLALVSGGGQTAPASTALPQPVVVKVTDVAGNGIAGVTVSFAVATGGGSVSPTSGASNAQGLVSTSWTLGSLVGTQTLNASATGLVPNPLVIAATAGAPIATPPATQLAFSVQPSTTTAGAVITPAVQVTAKDSLGATATGFTGTVTLALGANPGGATLSGTLAVAAVAGVATFNNVSLNKAGTGYTLTASATGLTGATSATFDITPGAAAQLVFFTQPSSVTAGIPIAPSPVVQARDAAGNVATGFTGTVTLALGANPGGTTLSGTLSVAAVAGSATFSNLRLNRTGSGYTLVASATGLTSATSNPFNVTPAPAFAMLIYSGNGQSALAGTTLAAPLVVLVGDSLANAVPGASVTFAVASGGGSVGTPNAVTDANGLASTTWTLGATPGSQTVTATSAGLAGSPLTFTATGTTAIANLLWTGATSTAWTTASNWSPAQAPAPTDSVFIPAGGNQPVIGSPVTVAKLYLATGATLTANATLTITGAVDAGTTIGGSGSVVLSGTSGTIKGAINTPVNVSAGTWSLAGATTVGNHVTVSGTGILDIGASSLVVDSTFSTSGTGLLRMQSGTGTMTVKGNATFNGGYELGNLTAGTLELRGNFTALGGAAGAPFAASGTHKTIFAGSGTQAVSITEISGATTFAHVDFAGPSSISVTSRFFATGAVNVLAASGNIVGTGHWAVLGGGVATPSLTEASGGAKWRFDTTSMLVNNGGSIVVPATLTGLFIAQASGPGVAYLAANLTVDSLRLPFGGLRPNSRTLVVNGALTAAGSGCLAMQSPADSVVVNGDATFGGACAIPHSTAGKLVLRGNFVQTGTAFAFNATSGHTTILAGGANETVSFARPDTTLGGAGCGSNCLGNLTIAKSGGTVTFLTASNMQGNLTVNAGVTAVDAIGAAGSPKPVTLLGNLTTAAGTGVHFTRVGTKGNVALDASTLIDSIGFFGTSSQTIPAGAYGIVRIGGTPTLGGNISAAGIRVVGTGASFAIGANTVTVSGDFGTDSAGVLAMTNSAGALNVTGNVTFGGGNTTGLLTNGAISVGGNFAQVNGGTGREFNAAVSSMNVLLTGSANQTITFANPDLSSVPGCALSCFGDFIVNKAGGSLTFNSPVRITGNAVLNAGASAVNAVGTAGNPRFVIVQGNVTTAAALPVHFTWMGLAGSPNLGAATVVDTIGFLGTAAQTIPAGTYNSVEILGTPTLGGNITVTGHLEVGTGGVFTLGGRKVTVNGFFETFDTGVLAMSNDADSLVVTGSIFFGGGTSAPSAGTIVARGNVVGTGTTFQATGTNVLVMLANHVTPSALNFTAPVAGKGINKLVFDGSGVGLLPTSVLGNVNVLTDVVLTPSSAKVEGAGTVNIAGNFLDSTASADTVGTWRVANTNFNGSGPQQLVVLGYYMQTNLAVTGGVLKPTGYLWNNGSISVSGVNAIFDLDGQTVEVVGDFVTQAGGRLKQSDSEGGDFLIVYGDATFGGGSTAGLLIHGTTWFLGNFVQAGGAPDAYAPDSTHITKFGFLPPGDSRGAPRPPLVPRPGAGGRPLVTSPSTGTRERAEFQARIAKLTAPVRDPRGRVIQPVRVRRAAGSASFTLANTMDPPAIQFANPGGGAGTSHFGKLVLLTGSRQLLTNAYVAGQVVGGHYFQATSDRVLTARGADVSGITFDNVRWLLVDGNDAWFLDGVTFQNISATAQPQFEVQRAGNPTCECPTDLPTLSYWTFNTVPTGAGVYIKATDTNPTDGYVLTIDLTNQYPPVHGGFVATSGGAVINWQSGFATAIGSGNWESPSTWSSNAVPDSNIMVTIPAGTTVTITTSGPEGPPYEWQVRSLTIEGSGILAQGANNLSVLGDLVTDTLVGGITCSTGITYQPEGTPATLRGRLCRYHSGREITATGRITVDSVFHVHDQTFTFNGHKVVTREAWVATTPGSNGGLIMTNAADTLMVTDSLWVGDPVSSAAPTSVLTNGTILLAGNFRQVGAPSSGYFNATATHVTKFTGSGQVNFADTTASGFGTVFVSGAARTIATVTRVSGDFNVASGSTVSGINGRLKIAGTLSGSSASTVNVMAVELGGVYADSGTFSPDTAVFTGGTVPSPQVIPDTLAVGTGPTLKSVRITGAAQMLAKNGNNDFNVNGKLVITGSLRIGGNGNVVIVSVIDSLITSATGVLRMLDANASIVALGHVVFGGGSTTGLLTAGTLTVQKSLRQSGAASSFAPSGSHTTVIGYAGSNDTVTFASPASSFFQNLTVNSGAVVVLENDITVNGTLTRGTGVSTPQLIGAAPRLITASGLSITGNPTSFVRVALKFVDGVAGAGTLDNVTFQNFGATYGGTIFEVARTTGGPFTFNSLTWNAQTLSASGRYLLNSGSQAITLVSPSPSAAAANTACGCATYQQTTGSGSITWP